MKAEIIINSDCLEYWKLREREWSQSVAWVREIALNRANQWPESTPNKSVNLRLKQCPRFEETFKNPQWTSIQRISSKFSTLISPLKVPPQLHKGMRTVAAMKEKSKSCTLQRWASNFRFYEVWMCEGLIIWRTSSIASIYGSIQRDLSGRAVDLWCLKSSPRFYMRMREVAAVRDEGKSSTLQWWPGNLRFCKRGESKSCTLERFATVAG